jgi:hypothetical protein
MKHPLQVKLFIVENFLTFFRPKTPTDQKPVFSILQIATEREFGLFSISEHENILVVWATYSNGTPLNFYCDVQPQSFAGFEVSIDKIGFLLIGAGIPYA